MSIAAVNELNGLVLPQSHSGFSVFSMGGSMTPNGLASFGWNMPSVTSYFAFLSPTLIGRNITLDLTYSTNLPLGISAGVFPGMNGLGYFLGFYFFSNPVQAVLGTIDATVKNDVHILLRNLTRQEFDDYFDLNSPQYAFLDFKYESVYFVSTHPKQITQFSSSNPESLAFVAKYPLNVDLGATISFFTAPIFEGYLYSVSQNSTNFDSNNQNIILFNVTRFPVPGYAYPELPTQSVLFTTYGNIVCFAFNTNTSELFLGTNYNKVARIGLREGNMTFGGVMSLYPSSQTSIYGGPMQSMIVDNANNLLYVETGFWGDFYRVDLNKFCPDGQNCKEKTPSNDNPSKKPGSNKIHTTVALVLSIVGVGIIASIVIFIRRRRNSGVYQKINS
eukprot:TRINITY_DN3162_c0_g1_i1.p1 TRINITY_DN3162_c0_g1~~TRINITY_DN3162_c0_g1_i1.p1  ORF type:complete len:390 (+),score=73.26 TRINITY_DN3162_c0_g1_i1:1583-2752(+)